MLACLINSEPSAHFLIASERAGARQGARSRVNVPSQLLWLAKSLERFSILCTSLTDIIMHY